MLNIAVENNKSATTFSAATGSLFTCERKNVVQSTERTRNTVHVHFVFHTL